MKITFTDKTSIDNRPDLSDVEKITGRNINEIKNVVNANADELESTKVKTENLSTDVEALKQKNTAQCLFSHEIVSLLFLRNPAWIGCGEALSEPTGCHMTVFEQEIRPIPMIFVGNPVWLCLIVHVVIVII